MTNLALKVEDVSKMYRLGQVGTGTLSHDLNRVWARLRGREDPFAKIGAVNDREAAGGDYVWALRHVDFEVVQGEIVGIIGRNGAGKSTLLKLLSRVTAPTEGQIRINGRIASLLEVGTGFHPELTGRENIYLNGAILGMSRREISARLDEIVDFSGCAKYIDTPVKRYSSGMHVRLAFAVAAHLETDILIVDEVLAVGDADFQQKCLGKMQDMSRQSHRTVLFVSHNMAAVKRLCPRCVVVNKGRIAFDGPQAEAIGYYLNENERTDTQLSERTDRNGLGQIQLVNTDVLDKDQQPTARLFAGEKYTILLKFSAQSECRNVNVSVALFNHENMILADLTTQSTSFRLSKVNGDWELYCTIDRLPLNVGNYSYSVYCTTNDDLQDHIEFAGKFEVIGGDFFGSPKLPSPTAGSTLIDHNWKWRS